MQAASRKHRLTTAACLTGLLAFAVAAGQSADPARVLVFSATDGARPDGVDRGNAALGEMADESGQFTVDVSEDPAVLTAATLSEYDLVLFNNPSGEGDAAPFTADQRSQFAAWVECGGGFVGVGQALDAWGDWADWDELVGVDADASTSGAVKLTVQADSPITAPFGPKGAMVTITDTLTDVSSGQGPTDLSSDVVELLRGPKGATAWTSTFRGANQSFVTGLGQSAATWDLGSFRKHVVAGIAHAAEVRPDADCVRAIGGSSTTLPVGATMVVMSPPASSNTSPVRYAPDTVVLTAGSSVVLANVDTVAHTITDASGKKLFDSGFVSLGATAPVVGVESLSPGTYDFVCQLHPVMVGTITIV